MLKKEFKDILKQSFFFIITIAAIPAFLLLTKIITGMSFMSLFFPVFQFGLLFFALFLGASLFSMERGQRGMEYLLSLPFSRLKLLGLKVLPRLCAVIFFYVVHWLIYQDGGSDYAALSVLSFSIQYFFLFLIALSLSAASDNFIVLAVGSGFIMFILLSLFYFIFIVVSMLKYGSDLGAFSFGDLFIAEVGLDFLPQLIISAVVLVLPFIITNILCFRKFDIRPARVYNLRFLKILSPLFLVGLVAAFFIAKTTKLYDYHAYYLTTDHVLIENTLTSLKVSNNKKQTKIPNFYYVNLWNCFESNNYLIFQGHTIEKDDYQAGIYRLDLKSKEIKLLYNFPNQNAFSYFAYKYKDTIFRLERGESPEEMILISIKIPEGQIKKYIYTHPLFTSNKRKYLVLCGIGKEHAKQYWLIYPYYHKDITVLRLWEDGSIDNLGILPHRPHWITNKRFMMWSPEKIFLYKIENNALIKTHEFPGTFHSLPYQFGRLDLNLKDIYFKSGNSIIRLNVEIPEFTAIGETNADIRFTPPNIFYYQEGKETNKLYLMKEDKAHFIMESPYRFEVYPTGILLVDRSDKAVKAYSLPDLNELIFPGLK
jgi:hypothetical protein